MEESERETEGEGQCMTGQVLGGWGGVGAKSSSSTVRRKFQNGNVRRK